MRAVARPETICWIRMSILSGGERAPLLPHAPPPFRDSCYRSALRFESLPLLRVPPVSARGLVHRALSIRDRSGGGGRSFLARGRVPTTRPAPSRGGRGVGPGRGPAPRFAPPGRRPA